MLRRMIFRVEKRVNFGCRKRGSSPTVKEGVLSDAQALAHGRATPPQRSYKLRFFAIVDQLGNQYWIKR